MSNELMETALQTYDAHHAASGMAITTPKKQVSRDFIQSIGVKPGLNIVTITSTRSLKTFAFLDQVFAAFERHEIHFDFVTVSEIAVSVVLENLEKLVAIERDLGNVGRLKVERDKALVFLVVGKGNLDTNDASQIFQAIERFNVHLISQSDAGKKMAFVVNESEVDAVAFSLFEEFFEMIIVSNAVAGYVVPPSGGRFRILNASA